MADIKTFSEQVIENLEKVVVGKRDSLELIVIGLLCHGHVLIEDVPGVGKTTLLNTLIGAAQYATKTVSRKESKGRHATSRRQLIRLDSGAMLIDTPGMRELGNFSAAKGVQETFAEISALAEQCRFRDCSHIGEKDCAVAAAVEQGTLPADRYENYLKMIRESAFHEMSYFEKRKKEWFLDRVQYPQTDPCFRCQFYR